MENDKVEMNGSRSIALPCFLIGVATGVALAGLLAPRSGFATRRAIGRTMHEGEAWVKATATAAQEYVKAQRADLQERIKDVAEVIGRGSPEGEDEELVASRR